MTENNQSAVPVSQRHENLAADIADLWSDGLEKQAAELVADFESDILAGQSVGDYETLIAQAAKLIRPEDAEAVFYVRVGGEYSQLTTHAGKNADPAACLDKAIAALIAEKEDAANCPVHAATPASDSPTEVEALRAENARLREALEQPWSWPCPEGGAHCCCDCDDCCDCDRPRSIMPDWQNAETCIENVLECYATDSASDADGPVDTVVNSGDLFVILSLAGAAFRARAGAAFRARAARPTGES